MFSTQCQAILFLDPWLHRKNNKNPKSKSQTGSANSNGIDPSYSALAAAGLRVGSLPWSIPRPKNGGLDSPALGKLSSMLLLSHIYTRFLSLFLLLEFFYSHLILTACI